MVIFVTVNLNHTAASTGTHRLSVGNYCRHDIIYVSMATLLSCAVLSSVVISCREASIVRDLDLGFGVFGIDLSLSESEHLCLNIVPNHILTPQAVL